MTRGAPKGLLIVAGLGWLIFAAGVVSFIFLYFKHGATNVPKVHWSSHWAWTRPDLETFRDPEGRFLLDYPSDWDMSAPFERFTRHRVGDLVALDTMALRHVNPTGILVIIRYVAPRPQPAKEWLKLTQAKGILADAFGDTLLSRTPTHRAGHQALQVTGTGMVADTRYRLESEFIPDGANAYRLTLGAPVTEFAAAAPALRRIASSFRFIPSARRAPGTRPINVAL